MSTSPRTLVDILTEAQRVGTLGPLPVSDVIDHSRQFIAALEGVAGRVLDMGTGAGIPGLVIADLRPDLEVVLLDRREARIDALRRGVSALGWSERVIVVVGDAEVVGKSPDWSGSFAAVVTRGFGPPTSTLRAARRFLAPGGVLVVSEPPQRDPQRWPQEVLRELGFSEPQYLQGIAMFHVEQSPS